MQIVNFFYELARQHKRVNGFMYDRSYEKGAANEAHPLVWLDDPVMGTKAGNVIRYTINLDILDIPTTDGDVVTIQGDALSIGLSMIYQIEKVRHLSGFSVEGFSFLSLSDYYDNNAAGQRFTLTVMQANPVNRCAEDFDETKQFPDPKALPDFQVDNPNGCAVFNNASGLPDFNVTS